MAKYLNRVAKDAIDNNVAETIIIGHLVSIIFPVIGGAVILGGWLTLALIAVVRS